MNDRHENRNWKFDRAVPDGSGGFVRLYKSLKVAGVVKSVSKRGGSSACNTWDSVGYSLEGKAGLSSDGAQVWARSVEEALRIPEEVYLLAKAREHNESAPLDAPAFDYVAAAMEFRKQQAEGIK